MFKLGLCSVTFRDKSIDEVISICGDCALEGIEWGGDVHLKAGGERERILEVKAKCRAAGLATPGYGSYFDVLEHGPEQFAPVLETAGLLGADTIRVWPGWVRPEQVTAGQYRKIVETSRNIAGQAEQQGIRVAYEFHDNTCTEGGKNAMKLLAGVNHSNLLTYYQLIRPSETEWNLESLEAVYGRLAYLHVQANDDEDNFPLDDFREVWGGIISRLERRGYDGWLLFEFNRDNSVGQLKLDLELLRSLIGSPDIHSEFAGTSSPTSKRVFVVDDEDYQLACYRDALGDAEIEARFFSSASEALRAAGRDKPAVVLTDYTMPEMNGARLAKRLSELDPAVRVIVMTGQVGEVYDKLVAGMQGMANVEIVAKPVKLMDLLTRINEILELRESAEKQ